MSRILFVLPLLLLTFSVSALAQKAPTFGATPGAHYPPWNAKCPLDVDVHLPKALDGAEPLVPEGNDREPGSYTQRNDDIESPREFRRPVQLSPTTMAGCSCLA